MAVDRYPIPDSQSDQNDAISFILTISFVVDLVVRFLGWGVIEYFSDVSNTFDCVIVISSVVDLALSPLPTLFTGVVPASAKGGSLAALRAFRLLRLLRLFRNRAFKAMLIKIINVFVAMRAFLVLFFMFEFILALIGEQFFSNKLRFDANGLPITNIASDAFANAPEYPRNNFDDFSHAILAVFQMQQGDNWTGVMINLARALGPGVQLYPIFIFLLLKLRDD